MKDAEKLLLRDVPVVMYDNLYTCRSRHPTSGSRLRQGWVCHVEPHVAADALSCQSDAQDSRSGTRLPGEVTFQFRENLFRGRGRAPRQQGSVLPSTCARVRRVVAAAGPIRPRFGPGRGVATAGRPGRAALESFGATGDVLGMAGGTGWWTARLARTAGHLTVIDSSPETLDLNRDGVVRSDVDYLVADLFSWQPTRTYDVVSLLWLTCRGHGFPPSGRWSGPALHRGAGCSSSTTATNRIQMAGSRTPTSCGAVRILTCARCSAEASTRSSRCSTSPRSCRRFWATRVGRQDWMQRAGTPSEMRGWPPRRWAVATTRRLLDRLRVDRVILAVM